MIMQHPGDEEKLYEAVVNLVKAAWGTKGTSVETDFNQKNGVPRLDVFYSPGRDYAAGAEPAKLLDADLKVVFGKYKEHKHDFDSTETRNGLSITGTLDKLIDKVRNAASGKDKALKERLGVTFEENKQVGSTPPKMRAKPKPRGTHTGEATIDAARRSRKPAIGE